MGSILIVDDERSIRITVKAFLEADGHQVDTAEEVRSALAILQEKQIDVVLSDIILHRSTGIDLLKKIRESSPDVQVIMMTGEPTLETAAESLRLGAIDYLQKPVAKNDILKAVRNALNIKLLKDAKQRLEQENQRYVNQLEHLVDERTRALADSETALRRRAGELAILNRLSREVGASMPVDATIQAGLREIVHATSADFALVLLRNGDELAIGNICHGSVASSWRPEGVQKVGKCLCGLAVSEDSPLYSIDIHTDSRCKLGECRKAGFSSVAALPLKSGGEILGVLGLASTDPRDFSGQGPFLESLAGELSIGLKKSLLYEELEDRAIQLQASIQQIKETEAQRLQLETKLQQAQKLEAIGTLAGGIAHDFNNILAAIFGYTELALNAVPEGTVVHRRLTAVLDAGLRAKSLVQQILTFSREDKEVIGPVYPGPILKEALRLLRASLPATIEIRKHIQSKLAVIADPTKIHQVLMNLCANAAHAMCEEGGVLDVSVTDAFLDSQFVENNPGVSPGPHLRLMVSDTGQGMAQYVMDRMFDPFFTTKEKGEGTGLGLSVVHGIITGLKGHIMVRSEPGKGTSFEILLPAITSGTPSTRNPEALIPTGNERILLVDDEKSLVETNNLLLESLGYTVTGATSAREALEIFRSRPQEFDLVITDSTMPQMTGEKLAKALLEIRSDLPIIQCSGFSISNTPKGMTGTDFQAVLHKPVLMRELAEAVRRALDTAHRPAVDED